MYALQNKGNHLDNSIVLFKEKIIGIRFSVFYQLYSSVKK